MLQQVKSAEERWIERVGPPRMAVRSVFPRDAVAVIYKPARSAMTSGRDRTRQWKLHFERRLAPYIEPLMGWTADDDTLASEVELSFPSLEAAVGYAQRQGLNFIVQGAGTFTPKHQLVVDNASADLSGAASRRARRQRLEWVERTLGTDVIRHGLGPGDPAADYASPDEVLHDARLSPEQKRDVLRHWALNAYQIELALSRGEPQSEPSRLEEVITAMLDLEQEHSATAEKAQAAQSAA